MDDISSYGPRFRVGMDHLLLPLHAWNRHTDAAGSVPVARPSDAFGQGRL